MRNRPIRFFSGEFEFLSNFYPCLGSTLEHHYQAAKTLVAEQREAILACGSPGEAKYRGKNKRLTTMRPDWDTIKESVMESLLMLKFSDPGLRRMLRATGDRELIEGNSWHDNIWGDCECRECREIPGQNLLGKLLMKIRKEVHHAQAEKQIMFGERYGFTH